jgi:hypothetical protein
MAPSSNGTCCHVLPVPQDYRLRVELYDPRYFTLADVLIRQNSTLRQRRRRGGGRHGRRAPFIEAFDGISDLGSVSGSIDGGRLVLHLTSPVPGDLRRLFRGGPRHPGVARRGLGGARGERDGGGGRHLPGLDDGGTPHRSTARTRRSSRSRAARLPEGGALHARDRLRGRGWATAGRRPRTPSSRTCSSTTPTGPAGTRTAWATASISRTTRSIAFSLSEGSVWDMLKQVANNWVSEGQVYCRRGDDL